MLCYRDMVFCRFWRECAKGLGCERALTTEVEAKAAKHPFPLDQFPGKPTCFKEVLRLREDG